MEEVKQEIDFSKIDFNEEKTYAFLNIDDEIEKMKRIRLLQEEAKKRKQKTLFDNMVKAVNKELKKQNRKNLTEKVHTIDLPFAMDDKYPMYITANMDVVLKHYGIGLKYNEMKKEVEFEGIEHDRSIANVTFTNIRDLCAQHKFKVFKGDTSAFVYALAVKNRYNPIAKYLTECKEKTQKSNGEISKMLQTIKYDTADEERINFCNKMLLKWFLNCVHIAFNEIGAKRTCEIVPAFQGDQGKGKSKWAGRLVPEGFFKGDIILDLTDKDCKSDVLSHWIVELGEIGGTFRKSDRDRIKAFITSTVDTWRNSYAEFNCTYPRRTAMIATVNDKQFLVDKTGNRRFFIIPAKSLNYEHDVDIDKFWGEIMHLYETNKEPIYMTQEEQALNELYNSDSVTKTDTKIVLDDLFDWDSEVFGVCKLADITLKLKEMTGKCYSENAIKTVLEYHTCQYGRYTAGHKGDRKQGRYWKVPYVEGLTLPF